MSIRLIDKDELKKNPTGMTSNIDAKHFIPVKDNFFSKLELTQLKKTIYKTKKAEFRGAQIFEQTNEWSPGAREVGYNMLEDSGDALISSRGGDSNDVPFVDEKLTEKFQSAVEIEIGLKYTRHQLEAQDTRNQFGRGGIINIVKERGAFARRIISRTFDRGIFQGFKKYKMLGLQSLIPPSRQVTLPSGNEKTYYEKVKDTGTLNAATGEAKRLWANKTGLQLYDDLLRAKLEAVEKSDIFNADTLVVDSIAYRFLARPYSDLNNMTLLKYITNSTPQAEALFKNVYRTDAVAKSNNGRSNTYFLVCDTSVEIVEIPILRPPTVFPAKEDWNQEVKQLVAMRYAGLMVRYPGGFYFGDGHVELAV